MNNNQVPQNTRDKVKIFYLEHKCRNTIAIIAGSWQGIISLFYHMQSTGFGFSQSVSYIQTSNGIVLFNTYLIAMGALYCKKGGWFILSAIAALLTIVDFMS